MVDDGGKEWDLTPGVDGTRLEYRVPQNMIGKYELYILSSIR